MPKKAIVLLLGSLALAATAPVGALTSATILETGDLPFLDGHAHAEVQRARGEIDHAHEAVQLAQAFLAGTLADLEVPEPPEPPEPPEAPEFPGFNMMPDIGAIVDGALGQVYALGGPFSGAAGTPLIVAAHLETAQQSEFQEDLNVMGRILVKAANKASGGTKTRTAMGIKLQLPFGQTGPSSLYLEGYGAVFFLNVNYPLVAPPAKGEPSAEPEKPTDSTWEEARAELYGGSRARRSTGVAVGGTPPGSQLEYDAGRVDALKTALLEVARNASNIRHLKPDDQIVVVVQGTGQPSPKGPETGRHDGSGSRASGIAKAAASSTLLTIRFNKADAEAAAEHKLDSAAFAKRAVLWTR